jgi:hypothetical protein
MRDKLAGKETVNIVAPLKNLLADVLHIFDIWTDLYLAKLVYFFSREEVGDGSG